MAFYQRKRTRLKNFDYTRSNYYYVTICTAEHKCLFGEPGKLNWIGEIARSEMETLGTHYQNVLVDKFVVMPNHIHTILVIGGHDKETKNPNLSNVVGQYKSAVSKKVRSVVPEPVIWQRSFYEEVIRNEAHYLAVWNYIDGNPMKWKEDAYCIESC